MGKSQAAGTSLCHSADNKEGDLPGWRPGEVESPVGRERTWSECTCVSTHTCTCLITQSYI